MGSYSQISPDGNGPQQPRHSCCGHGPQQSPMGLCAMTEAGEEVGFLSPFSQSPLSCRVLLMLCYVCCLKLTVG